MTNDNTTTIAADATAPAASTATTTTTTTPALLPTKLTVGQIVPVKVKEVKDYGVTVKTEGGETALLKADQFSGGCNPNRRRKFTATRPGDELAVEVTSIRPPAADDKRKVKTNRVQVSERSIQDAFVLANVVPATETTAGTLLTGKAVSKNLAKGFVLVELTSGPAAGYLAILPAPYIASDRQARDRFIEQLEIGAEITGECLHCCRAEEAHVDLRIGITLIAEATRNAKEVLADTSKVYKGKVGRNRDGGVEVVFGPSDAPMTGILPLGELPAAAKSGGALRVKIASVVGDRINLTRRGV